MSKKKREFIERNIDNKKIEQRTLDGYLNATVVCNIARKDINDYLNLQETKDFLNHLSSKTEIPLSILIQKIEKDAQSESIWVHPSIALNIAQWIGLNFKDDIYDWVYEWMLENDFNLGNTTIKNDKKEKDVPKGFEGKIKEALEYNPNKKRE